MNEITRQDLIRKYSAALASFVALLALAFTVYEYHKTLSIASQKPYLEGFLNACTSLVESGAAVYVYSEKEDDRSKERKGEEISRFLTILYGTIKLFESDEVSRIVEVANRIGSELEVSESIKLTNLHELSKLCHDKLQVDWGFTNTAGG